MENDFIDFVALLYTKCTLMVDNTFLILLGRLDIVGSKRGEDCPLARDLLVHTLKYGESQLKGCVPVL